MACSRRSNHSASTLPHKTPFPLAEYQSPNGCPDLVALYPFGINEHRAYQDRALIWWRPLRADLAALRR